MSIKQIQVKVDDLALGMYVSSLDRPWSRTPFPLQGFLIRAAEDIESLRSYCEYVYIDVAKGRGPLSDLVKVSRSASGVNKTAVEIQPGVVAVKPLDINLDAYKTTTSVQQELIGAKRIASTLTGNLVLFTKKLAGGGKVDYSSLKLSVDAMVESVLRCPDAFTWLLKLRKGDQYTHDHSLRSSLWAVQFSRYIGMPKADICTLCVATLLKDIGKLRLPSEVLISKKRSREQEIEYRRFVGYGVEMLSNTHEVDKKVISVVRRHCERIDGSGFPQGLDGRQIPLLAQICGISTVYDAISNPRESDVPLTPSQAISTLYKLRNQTFNEELVLEFIQSVGLYPTGTMVELTSGDVGVVFEQNAGFRLQPYVAVAPQGNVPGSADMKKNAIIIDLKEELGAIKMLADNGSFKARSLAKLSITRDLDSSHYEIGLEDISPEYFKADGPVKMGFISGLKQKLWSRSA